MFYLQLCKFFVLTKEIFLGSGDQNRESGIISTIKSRAWRLLGKWSYDQSESTKTRLKNVAKLHLTSFQEIQAKFESVFPICGQPYPIRFMWKQCDCEWKIFFLGTNRSHCELLSIYKYTNDHIEWIFSVSAQVAFFCSTHFIHTHKSENIRHGEIGDFALWLALQFFAYC